MRFSGKPARLTQTAPSPNAIVPLAPGTSSAMDLDTLFVFGSMRSIFPSFSHSAQTDVPPTVAMLSVTGQRVVPRCLALDAYGERLLTGQLPAVWQVWDLKHQRVLHQGTAPTRRLTARR